MSAGPGQGGSYETVNGSFSRNLGDGDILENVLIRANGSSVEINATSNNWTIRNVGIIGGTGDMLACHVPDSNGTGIIDNVYIANQGSDNTIFTNGSHAGLLRITNSRFDGGQDIHYASPPGNPQSYSSLGKDVGQGGIVEHDTVYINDVDDYGIRLASPGSSANNVTIRNAGVALANLTGPSPGVTFSNVNVETSDTALRAGVHFDPNAATANLVTVTNLENANLVGGIQRNDLNGKSPVINGTIGRNPDMSIPAGIPATAEDAAAGNSTAKATPAPGGGVPGGTGSFPSGTPGPVQGFSSHSIEWIDSGFYSRTGPESLGLLDGSGAGIVSDGQANYIWAFNSMANPVGVFPGGQGSRGGLQGTGPQNNEPNDSLTQAPLTTQDFQFDSKVDFVNNLGGDPSGDSLSDDAMNAVGGLSERVKVNFPPGNYRLSGTNFDLTNPAGLGFVTGEPVAATGGQPSTPQDTGPTAQGDGGAQGPTISVPSGYSGNLLTVGGEFMWTGVGIDRSAGNAPGFVLNSGKTLIEGITLLGAEEASQAGETFTVGGTNNTVFRNVTSKAVDSGVERRGIRVDGSSKLWLENCSFLGYTAAGVDASLASGGVNVLGGVYKNNKGSQLIVPQGGFIIDAAEVRDDIESQYGTGSRGIEVV